MRPFPAVRQMCALQRTARPKYHTHINILFFVYSRLYSLKLYAYFLNDRLKITDCSYHSGYRLHTRHAAAIIRYDPLYRVASRSNSAWLNGYEHIWSFTLSLSRCYHWLLNMNPISISEYKDLTYSAHWTLNVMLSHEHGLFISRSVLELDRIFK